MKSSSGHNETVMTSPRICTRCGTVVAGYSPDGLCPKCLLLGGLKVDLQDPPMGKTVSLRLRYFGDYELLEEIAHGGMGVVYKARQTSLNRIVAVKLLLLGRFSTTEFVQRFRAEAAAAARLQHPNIVAIHEVGEHDGQHYFSMDYVEGHDLAELVRERPLPALQAARYLKLIAEAIHYAHEKGILHRDLKPSNILIDEFDQPRITDFGLAKFVIPASGGATGMEPVDTGTANALTITGQVLGSPSYMPPEQAVGRREEMNSGGDIYSIGAILFHLLTGRPPFLAESITETLDQVRYSEPVSPRVLNPSVPRDLETVCLKCLEKERARRYSTARELADELGRCLRDEPIRARPAGVVTKAARWCRRNPAVASLLFTVALVLTLGLAISTWQWQRAERNAKNARENLVRLSIANGTKLAEENDPLGALVWFAEGFSKDLGRSPEAEDIHRRRFGWISRRTPKLVQLWAYDQPVNFAQFIPDGRNIVITTGAAADAENAIRSVSVRDVNSGLVIHQFVPTNETGRINLTDDGRFLATGSARGTLRIWDIATGAVRARFRGHTDRILGVRFSPDGRLVLTFSADGLAQIVDAETGQPIAAPLKHDGLVSLGEFSPDGRLIVTSSGNRLRVWNANGGEPVTDWIKLDGAPSRILFSPNSRWIFAGQANTTAKLLDVTTGKPLAAGIHFDGFQPAVAFSPDSSRVAVATRDSFVRIWSATTGTLVAPPLRHEHAVFSLAFSPDGQRLATGAGDWKARVWDVASGELLAPPLCHGGMVNHVAFNTDGYHLATASEDGTARLWNLAVAPSFAPADPAQGKYQVVALSPNANRIAVGEGRKIILRSTRAKEPAAALSLDYKLEKILFSPDGETLMSIGAGTAQTWSVGDGKLLGTIYLTNRRSEVRFTADSKRVIVFDNQSCQLWDAATGAVVAPSRRIKDWPRTFSRDGRLAVLVAVTGAEIRDLISDQVIAALQQPGQADRAEFSPDEKRLLLNTWLAATSGREVWLWDLGANPPAPMLRMDKSERIGGVAVFSPDGKRIATGSHDSTAHIRDSRTGQPLTPVLKHRHAVRGVKFSPDGRFLLTWTANHYDVRIWDSKTGEPITPPVSAPPIRDAWFTEDLQQIVCVGGVNDRPYIASLAGDERPIRDLNLLAELLGGHRLDGIGGVAPLSSRALEERWRALKDRYDANFLFVSQGQ